MKTNTKEMVIGTVLGSLILALGAWIISHTSKVSALELRQQIEGKAVIEKIDTVEKNITQRLDRIEKKLDK